MKLHCFLAALIFIAMISILFAEPVIGQYNMLSSQYDIEADASGNVSIHVYSSDFMVGDPQIIVYAEDVPKLRTALQEIKSKYIEWESVARQNNITSLLPKLIPSPSLETFSVFSRWDFGGMVYGLGRSSLSVGFNINEGVAHVGITLPAQEASSNQFITWGGGCIQLFKSAAEIQSLYDALDPEIVQRYYQEVQRQNELFR